MKTAVVAVVAVVIGSMWFDELGLSKDLAGIYIYLHRLTICLGRDLTSSRKGSWSRQFKQSFGLPTSNPMSRQQIMLVASQPLLQAS